MSIIPLLIRMEHTHLFPCRSSLEDKRLTPAEDDGGAFFLSCYGNQVGPRMWFGVDIRYR
jgi:hypothetical protein